MKCLTSWFLCAKVFGMRSQRKEGGVTAGMSQSGSSINLSQGMSGKCLTNWFRHANMDDMKTPNKSGVVAESVHLRLLSLCARVVGMNRPANKRASGVPCVLRQASAPATLS